MRKFIQFTAFFLLAPLYAFSQCGTSQTVDFKNLGDFATPILTAPVISADLSVSGSDSVKVSNVGSLKGLGIKGGMLDVFVDTVGNEFVDFFFNTSLEKTGLAEDIYLFENFKSSTGKYYVEAFDENNNSLGIKAYPLDGNISAQFNNQPISWFRLNPSGPVGAIRLESITFTMQCSNWSPDIPTMNEWGLFLFGLIVTTLGVVGVYNIKHESSRIF